MTTKRNGLSESRLRFIDRSSEETASSGKGAFHPGRTSCPRDSLFLLLEAARLQDTDRNEDAELLFREALVPEGLPEPARARALYNLGATQYFLGKFPEAILSFSQVRLLSGRVRDLGYYYFAASMYRIVILRWIAGVTKEPGHIRRIRLLLAESRNWLEGTGRMTWESPVLLEEAICAGLEGDRATALDCAETSYSRAKTSSGFSWSKGYHAMMLSRCARETGDYNRSQAVMDEVVDLSGTPYSRMQVLTEQLRVLRYTDHPPYVRMQEIIRRILRDIRDLTSHRTTIEAWASMAIAYLVTGDFPSSLQALREVRRIALSDREFHQPCLLLEAYRCFQDCYGLLREGSGAEAGEFSEIIAQWSSEMRNILEVHRGIWRSAV